MSPTMTETPITPMHTSETPIPRNARQNIFDRMRLQKVDVAGELDEVAFLERLYNLKSLSSTDYRYSDASGDIWQHRINNDDWDDYWMFSDSRFDLMNAPPEDFLQFLCEVLHPIVRPNRDEALKLLQYFNNQLRPHGWCLVAVEDIDEHSRYEAQTIQNHHHHSVSQVQTAADALDAAWMKKEIDRAKDAIDTDPALAIGTAKDLLESCCKTILDKRGVAFSKSDNLPKLTKALMKEIKLTPDDIPNAAKGAENIKRILQNLSALPHYMAELRGLYGSGHGRDGKHKGLEPRHARLVVTSAAAFIGFVTETYQQRIESED